MDELTIIEVTRDTLVAVSRDGQRFTIPIDDSVRAKLGHPSPSPRAGVVASPKEIQTLLRSGLSVDDVAARTGTSSEHIARFEAPIVAELAFVLERALAVPVVADDVDSTFGEEISARIGEQGGRVLRWQSFRIDGEWVVGVRCVIGDVEEDATWSFDPRKMTLVPSNNAAVRISKSDSIDAALFPPLRVVAPASKPRFDSGEFEPLPPAVAVAVEEPVAVPVVAQPESNSVVIDVEAALIETASAEPIDIVDERQRRRGDRNDSMASHPSTGSIPIITPDMLEAPEDSPVAPDDVPASQVNDTTDVPAVDPEVFTDPTPSKSRRQRASMPTWDEIVFGTRPDDE